LRWRRETPPTPPVEEQLRWAERGLTVVTLDSDYTRVPGLLVLLLDRSALV
jgi:hypothetical protein